MSKKLPVFEYYFGDKWKSSEMRIYKNGQGEIEIDEIDLNKIDAEPEPVKKFQVPRNEVTEYATRLTEKGFFDYEQAFPPSLKGFGGGSTYFTLNWDGRTKKLDISPILMSGLSIPLQFSEEIEHILAYGGYEKKNSKSRLR